MLAGLLQWLFVCDFAAWAPFWCLSPLSPPDMHRSVHVTVQVRCEILFRTLLCEICFLLNWKFVVIAKSGDGFFAFYLQHLWALF